VLHLVEASLARVDNVAAARAVGSTAKVETGDLSNDMSAFRLIDIERSFDNLR
jgi:hypothetical protein